MALVKTSIRLDSELLEAFQDAVEGEWGKLKGAQNEALREAALLWLAYKSSLPVVLLNDNRSGRKMILLASELTSKLGTVLSKPELSVTPVAAEYFWEGIISRVAALLIDKLGRPTKARIQRVESGKVLEDLEGGDSNTAEWERRLFEWQDGVEGDVEISMMWKERKVVVAFLRPSFISVHKQSLVVTPFEKAETRTRSRSRTG